MLVPEYDLNNPVLLVEDDVISQGEAKWFRRELERIAGKNPHGPNLVLRWGPTYEDPMPTMKAIKYQDFTDADGKVWGERRWFIEIWRSPQFLVRSGRYKVLHDPDDLEEFYFCKGCDAELGKTEPTQCKCGSTRTYLRQIRSAGVGKLLKDFPREGCYDYWLRLERANFTYHPLDRQALQVTRALWEWELRPQNERDALEQADREIERRQMILEQRRQSGRAPQFGSELILPAHLQR